MIVDPGELTHELVLEEPGARTPTGGGGWTQKWRRMLDGVVWAKVRPLRGDERLRAQQAQANVSHEVTIRWRNDVDASKRFLLEGSRVLKIAGAPVNVDERDDWLVIPCREET
jgi:SPP1 family predicted phage head-tail adaptor